MRKIALLLAVLILLVSCSQDVEQIYNTVVYNKSNFPIYVRIYRTDDLADGAFIKVGPYTHQYLLIQDDGDYTVAFMLIGSKGETFAEGSFTVGNPSEVEEIIFDSRGRDVSWKITYK